MHFFARKKCQLLNKMKIVQPLLGVIRCNKCNSASLAVNHTTPDCRQSETHSLWYRQCLKNRFDASLYLILKVYGPDNRITRSAQWQSTINKY